MTYKIEPETVEHLAEAMTHSIATTMELLTAMQQFVEPEAAQALQDLLESMQAVMEAHSMKMRNIQ